MKKLLGIVVLGLLLSGNGYAEEIYLACGKKNKDKINIVFNNETAFERYKIKNRTEKNNDGSQNIYYWKRFNKIIIPVKKYIHKEKNQVKITTNSYNKNKAFCFNYS